MGKRFRDSAIWKKQWYRELPSPCKVAWDYILDNCDNVGVWEPDFKLAEFCIGENVNWECMKNNTNGNISLLPNGKWFVVDFCDFQYGELRKECKPHNSYLSLLRKHGLFERVSKGYPKGIDTLKEKEKEKEKDKELDKDIEKEKEKDIFGPSFISKPKQSWPNCKCGRPMMKKGKEWLCAECNSVQNGFTDVK